MKKRPFLLLSTSLVTTLSIVATPLLTLTSCGQKPAPTPTPTPEEWSKYFVKPTDQEFNKTAGDDLTGNYTIELKNALSSGQALFVNIYSQESSVAGAKIKALNNIKIEDKKVSFSITMVAPSVNKQTCVTHFTLKFTCKNNDQTIWESEVLSGFSLTGQLPEPVPGGHITCKEPHLSITNNDDWDNFYIPSRNFEFKIKDEIKPNYKFKASITSQKQTGGLYEEYDLARVACDEKINIPMKDDPKLCVYFTSESKEKITPLYSNIDNLDTQVTFNLQITCVETDAEGSEQVIWKEDINSLSLTYKVQPFTGKAKGNIQTINRSATQEKDRTTDAHFYLIDTMMADKWEPALLNPETGDVIDTSTFVDRIEVHNVTSITEGKYMQLFIIWKEDFIKARSQGEQMKFYFAAQPSVQYAPAPEPAFLCDIMCTITFS